MANLEKKRKKLERLASNKNVSNDDVIKASQKLDKLIAKEQSKLNKQPKNKNKEE